MESVECSAFSWRGKELPWARLKLSRAAILRDSLRERCVCPRSCYEDAVRGAPEEAQITVENINGPVLLICPEYDAMWPASRPAWKKCLSSSANRMMMTLQPQWQIRTSGGACGKQKARQLAALTVTGFLRPVIQCQGCSRRSQPRLPALLL